MGTKIDEAIAKVKELLFANPEVKEKFADLVDIKGWADFFNSFELIKWLGMRIVVTVEYVSKEYELIEPNKRLEVAAKFLDEQIRFGGWASPLEWFDDKIFKAILEYIVKWVDGLIGKVWTTTKVETELGLKLT